MSQLGHLLQFLHPEFDWLAVLLLNRWKVRSRTGHFLLCHLIAFPIRLTDFQISTQRIQIFSTIVQS